MSEQKKYIYKGEVYYYRNNQWYDSSFIKVSESMASMLRSFFGVKAVYGCTLKEKKRKSNQKSKKRNRYHVSNDALDHRVPGDMFRQ